MPENNSRTAFFRDKYARILTLVLILQVAGFYVISRRENVPLNRPLDQFSKQFSGWRMVQEDAVDKEILDVLRADDVMTRIYANPARNAVANLFVAYFRSQRTGQTPHSPKNCLPGAGWAPSESKIISVTVPGGGSHSRQSLHRYQGRPEERGAVLVPDAEPRDRQRVPGQDLSGRGCHSV